MREISFDSVKQAVMDGYKEICTGLDAKTLDALRYAYEVETAPQTKFALDIMLKNAEIAKKTCTPLCQDTGMALVFAEVGQDVKIIGGSLENAVNEAVRECYRENYFRKSVLDPITRQNTTDNTPAVIHYEIVPGDGLKLSIMAKGFGSENMGRLFMLVPSDGMEGIKKAVVQTVIDAGGKPCPPIILGVGIGGTMEKAALLSKKALFRELESHNKDTGLDKLEKEILSEINALGIGAQGFGGKVTAMGVFVETFPTHIAALPVAVSVQCHCSRHKEIVL